MSRGSRHMGTDDLERLRVLVDEEPDHCDLRTILELVRRMVVLQVLRRFICLLPHESDDRSAGSLAQVVGGLLVPVWKTRSECGVPRQRLASLKKLQCREALHVVLFCEFQVFFVCCVHLWRVFTTRQDVQ